MKTLEEFRIYVENKGSTALVQDDVITHYFSCVFSEHYKSQYALKFRLNEKLKYYEERMREETNEKEKIFYTKCFNALLDLWNYLMDEK